MSSGVFAIITSYLNNIYAVFIASSLVYVTYNIYYLNKYSFFREQFNEKLETITPSFMAFCYGMGTIAFPI